MKGITIGDGAPRALLLPGNDLCAEFYVPLAGELAERGLSTTLLSLPGFAGEPALERPSWESLLDAVCDQVEPSHTVLLGHSAGGLLALLLARRLTGVQDLVLLEPTIFSHRFLAAAAARSYLSRVVHKDRARFVNWNGATRRVADPERYPADKIELYVRGRTESDPETAAALFSGLAELYPLPFDQISARVSYIRGSHSGWRGRLFLSCTRRRLPGPVHVLPAAAHWLANEDDPRLAELILRCVD